MSPRRPFPTAWRIMMNSKRREFFRRVLWGAGALGSAKAWVAQAKPSMDRDQTHPVRGQAGLEPHLGRAGARQRVPVETPDVPDLAFELDNGVKVFHLIAEPAKRELVPGKVVNLWGYNGSSPGPTIQVTQGDRVRIVFDNHLPEPTSMHWHGFEIPIEMDGAPGGSQTPVPPGGRFIYEFSLYQEGTYFYHPHMAMQEMMGLLGAFIMHPQKPYDPPVDRDFVIMLQEYAVLPNSATPNSMNMEFNWLTFNGKSGPAITPLIVRLGDRVRIRLINLGMDHHPIHLHGHTFWVTGTEAGRRPRASWDPENTVLVGVAQARDIEFVANNPGDWMLHCHLPHHMMNQMSSTVGPITRNGRGMPAGVGMEEGMGMLRGAPGTPAGEDYGPSLGRGLGVGSTNDRPVSNSPFFQQNATAAIADQRRTPEGMQGMPHGMHMEAGVSPDANSVPGFPQDAYMEGPMMAMDQLVEKPQNYGLSAGWSGFMQGMMTFVRVLSPARYEEVMAGIRRG